MSWSNFVHRSAVEVRPHRQRARRRWTPQTHHLRMGPWRISLRPHSLSRRISLKLPSLPHSQHLENLGPLESSQRCSPRPSQLEVAVIRTSEPQDSVYSHTCRSMFKVERKLSSLWLPPGVWRCTRDNVLGWEGGAHQVYSNSREWERIPPWTVVFESILRLGPARCRML